MPDGYWDVSRQRSFMESLAKALNITDNEGWYKLTVGDMQKSKYGRSILSKHGGSINKLLTTVFPEYPNKYS